MSRETIAAVLQNFGIRQDQKQFVNSCETAIAVVVARYSAVLSNVFPQETRQINLGLDRVLRSEANNNFVPDSTEVIAKSWILTSASRLDPALTDQRYARKLAFLQNNRHTFYPDDENNGRDQILEPLFRTILNAGGLPLDCPEAQILATFFMGKLAQKIAITDATNLLVSAALFVGLTCADKIPTHLKGLSSKVGNLRGHLGLMELASRRIDDAADEAYLDSEQVNLLLEVASLKRSTLGQQYYGRVIELIVGSLTKGNWYEAIASRNFLFRCLPKAFPPESRDNGYICSDKTQEVYRKLMNERMLSSVGISPAEAKDIVGRRSGLAKAIVTELDIEIRLADFRRYLDKRLGSRFAAAVNQVFIQYQDKDQRKKEFVKIAASIGSIVGEAEFDNLQKKYEIVLARQAPPYMLRPDQDHDIYVSRIDITGGEAVYYQRIGFDQEIVGKFGQLLVKIIKTSLTKHTKGALDAVQLKAAFTRAYRVAINRDSALAEESLGKCVAAIIIASGIKLSTEAENMKISRFVADL